jgi:hypothetical protein
MDAIFHTAYNSASFRITFNSSFTIHHTVRHHVDWDTDSDLNKPHIYANKQTTNASSSYGGIHTTILLSEYAKSGFL